MNTITLHMENRADNTAVSNYFIDTLMPQANGEFVKIYLYLLRCVSAGHISLSVSEMADLFNQTEDDILRGLRYWDKMNALRLNFSPDAITLRPGTGTGCSPADCTSRSPRPAGARRAGASCMASGCARVRCSSTTLIGSTPRRSCRCSPNTTSRRTVRRPRCTGC